MLTRYHQAFLEDERFAATLPALGRRPGQRDASPVIDPRVGWFQASAEARERYRQSLPPGVRGLEIDEDLAAKAGKDWLDADPPLWHRLDFGWMATLGEYDSWDTHRGPPRSTFPGVPSYAQEPVPDAVKLAAWAKLRLAKGLHDGAPAPAIREVEDLARLCVTVEETGVVAVGLGLLAYADRARERAFASGFRSDLGKAIGTEGIRRLHRALWGAIAHAELRASPTFDGDWGEIVLGRCAALATALTFALPARPLLHDSYRAEYVRLGDLLARSPECRLTKLRWAWAEPDAADQVTELMGKSWFERVATRWVPGVARLKGEILVSIGEQDWFRKYDESDGGMPPTEDKSSETRAPR